MNRQLAPDKVISEVHQLTNRLHNSLKGGKRFEPIHRDVLGLCELVFDSKKDYELIRVPYPKKILFKSSVPRPAIERRTQIINMTPNYESDLKRLANNILIVLDKIKRLYVLKKKLSPKHSVPTSQNNDTRK